MNWSGRERVSGSSATGGGYFSPRALASSSRLIPARPGRSRCLASSYSSARVLGLALRVLDAAVVRGAAARVLDAAAAVLGAPAVLAAAVRVLGALAAVLGAAAVLAAAVRVLGALAAVLGAAPVLAAAAPARVRRTTAAPCWPIAATGPSGNR